MPGFRFALSPPGAGARPRAWPRGFGLLPAGTFSPWPPAAAANLPVLGSGTVGRLAKWTGLTSSNSYLGDTTIFENKSGLVGIGTDAPTSRLTVAGTIESLAGGFKFPDGTVQTTAGVAPNQVVRSLNGLMGDLTLVPGANISITPGANTLTIAASGLLSGITHDATLVGNGTAGSPLGVAVPLILIGSVEEPGPGFRGVEVVDSACPIHEQAESPINRYFGGFEWAFPAATDLRAPATTQRRRSWPTTTVARTVVTLHEPSVTVASIV